MSYFPDILYPPLWTLLSLERPLFMFYWLLKT